MLADRHMNWQPTARPRTAVPGQIPKLIVQPSAPYLPRVGHTWDGA